MEQIETRDNCDAAQITPQTGKVKHVVDRIMNLGRRKKYDKVQKSRIPVHSGKLARSVSVREQGTNHAADALFTSIRNDFEFGLSQDSDRILKICQSMEVNKVGELSRQVVSAYMIPYMRDIFNAELDKQKSFSVRYPKALSAPEDAYRNETVSWIIDQSQTLGYTPETVHLASFIVDAYATSKGNRMRYFSWKLLAVTALHMAAKFEELGAVPVYILIKKSGKWFTLQDVINMEADILHKLDFYLSPPSAPFLASLVLHGGSMRMPSANLRKLTHDLVQGILYQSLKYHTLFPYSAADKAKAALETAVDYIYHNYDFCIKRDMSAFAYRSNHHIPGQALGEFSMNMCTKMFVKRLTEKEKKIATIPLPTRFGALSIASPRKLFNQTLSS